MNESLGMYFTLSIRTQHSQRNYHKQRKLQQSATYTNSAQNTVSYTHKTLRQIHLLDDEHDNITSQQKLNQTDRERLVEIYKLKEIWTK